MHNIQQPKQDNRQRVTLFTAKDFEVSHFCGSGAGGQARNKVASGVQITHRESGAIGRASDSRSEADNKSNAFIRLLKTPKMKFEIERKLYELKQHETMEETVAKETKPENLKFEIKNGKGQWEEVDVSYFEGETAKEESEP